MPSTALLEKVRLHVRRHFARHMPRWMVFHDLEHTLAVARFTLEIGRNVGLSKAQLQILEIASLFHDTGYSKAYKGHERHSARMADAFLRAHGAGTGIRTQVAKLILCTRMEVGPRSLMQRVMRDADSAKAGQADFEDKSLRLRLELGHLRKHVIDGRAWTVENLNYLQHHRFHTPYAQRRFGRQKAINLKRLVDEVKRTTGKAKAPDLVKDRYFDRDLSWLAFNARVLQEAHDDRVPLLDRLKFLAIHSSNLDEFYRVRVAHLRGLRKLRRSDRSALEVPPEKRVERINTIALAQQRDLGRLYRDELLPALARKGVRFLREDELNHAQRAAVLAYFSDRVAPLLQTASLRKGNAPFIEDRKLYLVCDLLQKGSHAHKRVLLNVPSEELGRFITLPSAKGRSDLIFLDDAIRLCAPRFFTGFKLTACYAIKLSRDAELYLDEEFAENVVDKVRRSLRKRRTGVPARFLHDGAMPAPMLRQLRELLGVKKEELIRGGRYHNISDLMDLPVKAPSGTQEPPLTPLRPQWAGRHADLFAQIRRSDRLLHFPYHDFSIVTDLLRRAARDPLVTTISITLYRVARASLICEALIEAARQGKKVTAVVEVQARFDEGNNLFWGEALEQAGARVIYSHEDVKVHCKLCLIERKEARRTARYAYLGTGNFHERTAKVYSDTALLTANRNVAQEVASVFRYLGDGTRTPNCKRLMLAPLGLRTGIERAIDREIAQALSGRPAALMMKLNSLEDRPMISKLYDASRAGVTVQLIVRGICCLIPGVRGMSDNIEAISIVDRFLEHSRAYVFHNAGDPQVYLASADMMQRNLDRRVETAFPILDKALRQQVLDVLELQWKDEAKARRIDAGQLNAYRDPRWNAARARRSQLSIYAYLRKAEPPSPRGKR